jgi:uncharacterized membrane protein
MSTTAPVPPVSPGEDLELVIPGRVVDAGKGWEWVAGGWRLFVRAPLMWIISIILVFICFVAVNFVPFLGNIATALFQPVVLAGFVVASHSLDRGGDFELDHLLAGFKNTFGNLVVVGLLFLLGECVILLVFVAFLLMTVGAAVLAAGTEEISHVIMASIPAFVLGGLIALALLVPLVAAYWFAPALVVMHEMQPLDAMKASFAACFRNFLPFLVYSVLLLLLGIVAAIPLGLGYLVLVPMMIAGIYVSYRDIFTQERAPAAAKPTFA